MRLSKQDQINWKYLVTFPVKQSKILQARSCSTSVPGEIMHNWDRERKIKGYATREKEKGLRKGFILVGDYFLSFVVVTSIRPSFLTLEYRLYFENCLIPSSSKAKQLFFQTELSVSYLLQTPGTIAVKPDFYKLS